MTANSCPAMGAFVLPAGGEYLVALSRLGPFLLTVGVRHADLAGLPCSQDSLQSRIPLLCEPLRMTRMTGWT